ncbi:SLC13 family permease [Testudinibacter sp. TR-2022]|uniref:SLC13 family permease n=1 Tax=Testudinibacter sp. TR-2022 TaxID=2585029 RepID=UPI0011189FA5|nr:SLC13 family permease [Testudinibacter sp. TR-2022]TNH01772.1 SLC13 family permease [Pasteurellaceae bacterium Phil31]TNH07299.1 SLC13 family permease [Testudinibacter sp. TR-2022]TNH07999.1 SLC13 family permease [Testudinibacter sp. TR-2022]TNH10288.1 SLC13 family permease [Testudinibacter sp. TR-2022]TNH13994.1 SLC13 family permease [Testudinibacter sp. TR-2022]
MLLQQYLSISPPLFLVLAFLLVAVWLFISNKIRMDVVALLVMVAFSLSGILSVPEILAGFSDPNIILIALLFVVGEGLLRTGVAYQVSEWLIKAADNNEVKILVLLMVAVAGLGAFMSSTGIVAIFIPVVLAICAQMNISPKRLMMPLSVAGLTSGMTTLIATPPNLIANAELVRAGEPPLGFFTFTPIGLMVLVLGIGYMLFARRFLDSDNQGHEKNNYNRTSMNDLIESYQVQDRSKQALVMPGSRLIGKTLDELHLHSQYRILVVAVERWRRIRHIVVTASALTDVREKDILLLDIANNDLDWTQFCEEYGLKPIEVRGNYYSEKAKSVGMAEISPIPESANLGKTVREIKFQHKYGLIIAGVKRGTKRITEELADVVITTGDQYLVIGDWKQIRELRSSNKDFFMLNYPSEIDQVAPAITQAPHAILSVVTMVALMVSGVVPNVIAALIACMMLAKFRCIDARSAYNSIHWPSLILIVGMMPFAIALDKTGGISLAVSGLIELVGEWGIHGVLASLFILCALIGLFISNTATAILMTPIGVALANELQTSALPFVITIAVAASAAFMTPVSSPVNTMVLGPGGYKFSDFLKIGVPFTIIVMIATVLVVPILFG